MSTPYGNDPYGNQGGQNPPGDNPYGQPVGQYGSPYSYPGGPTETTKTDGVSIASLVLGLVCCAPVGLVLGFVGLRRTKGGQRKGRGMAIGGIVLGLLGLVIWGLLVIGSIAGIGFLNSIVTPENAEVGQCVNIDEEDNEVLLRETECGEEHDGEIVAVVTVTGDNRAAVQDGMVDYCLQAIDDADRAKLTDYLQDIQAVTEDPEDVEVGDHLVCYVEPGDKLDSGIL